MKNSLITFSIFLGILGFNYSGINDKSILIESPKHIVAIDMGHGGIDTGAQGIIDEVEMIEKVGLRLQILLESDPAIQVVMTRDFNEYKTIEQRNKIVNENNCDLLISLHGNSSEYLSASGFEVLSSAPYRQNYENSLKFAKIVYDQVSKLNIKMRNIRYVYYQEVNNNIYEKLIYDHDDIVVSDMPSLGIIDGSNCPAILIEQLFVTSNYDMEMLDDQLYDKFAMAYYKAIKMYLGENNANKMF